MSKLLKIIGAQFGFSSPDEAVPEPAPQNIDPEARRLAEAEINGSLVIAERRGDLPRDALLGDQTANIGKLRPSAVGSDGSIDFDRFFEQINIPHEEFTADHAINIIENVQRTIPPIISEPEQRNALIRNVLIGTMSGPAAQERLVADANQRSRALTGLLRQRLNATAELKQRAESKIAELEKQIAANKEAIASAERQLSTLSANCKERQAKYDAMIDLFAQPTGKPPKSGS